MEWGVLNWPGSAPVAPQDFANRPVLSNLATRAFVYPSETKMLPAASQATSVGWLKLSPGTPAPGGPPRPPPPPPPPRPAPPPAPALLPISPIASGVRPRIMRMRPDGSNFMIVLEPRSTTQTLF